MYKEKKNAGNENIVRDNKTTTEDRENTLEEERKIKFSCQRTAHYYYYYYLLIIVIIT